MTVFDELIRRLTMPKEKISEHGDRSKEISQLKCTEGKSLTKT